MDPKRIFLAGFLIVLVWIVWQGFFAPAPVETTKEETKTTVQKKLEPPKESPVENIHCPESKIRRKLSPDGVRVCCHHTFGFHHNVIKNYNRNSHLEMSKRPALPVTLAQIDKEECV